MLYFPGFYRTRASVAIPHLRAVYQEQQLADPTAITAMRLRVIEAFGRIRPGKQTTSLIVDALQDRSLDLRLRSIAAWALLNIGHFDESIEHALAEAAEENDDSLRTSGETLKHLRIHKTK